MIVFFGISSAKFKSFGLDFDYTFLRYTIYNIRLGRNVKCACDDCCGLKNLKIRFEEDGKPEEAAMAANALYQHKKRADWKQSRYRTRRANAAASLNDTRALSVQKRNIKLLFHLNQNLQIKFLLSRKI